MRFRFGPFAYILMFAGVVGGFVAVGAFGALVAGPIGAAIGGLIDGYFSPNERE